MLRDLVRLFSQTSANADASDPTISRRRWIEALSRFSPFFRSDVVLERLRPHSSWTLKSTHGVNASVSMDHDLPVLPFLVDSLQRQRIAVCESLQ